MATTTERPSATDLQEARDARVAREQAALAEARARAEAEAAAAAAATGSSDGIQVDGQDGLFDTVIENDDLEKALESREKVKASRAALNAKFKEADEFAKAFIAGLEIEVGEPVRVGRFRIELSEVKARSVSFETEATERLSIIAGD